jgi:Kinesin motor domain
MLHQQPQSPLFKVYVRWRPLSPSELAATEIQRSLEHNNSYVSVSLASQTRLGRHRLWRSAASFAQVFETSAGNRDIFEAVVAPTLPRVLNGATCNFFAYGHSGSGKTHTIIGYDYDDHGKLGLCLAAAYDLFKALDGLNVGWSSDKEGEDHERLGIGIRLYEMRKKSAFDLLNGRRECHVREGYDGQTHIRGETEVLEGGKVRVHPIATRPCWTFDELRRELQVGLQLRATGSSTMHDQSSRTHAVLELEVVNKALLDARDSVIERQSELVPVAKRTTDIFLEEAYSRTPNEARIDAAEARRESLSPT